MLFAFGFRFVSPINALQKVLGENKVAQYPLSGI